MTTPGGHRPPDPVDAGTARWAAQLAVALHAAGDEQGVLERVAAEASAALGAADAVSVTMRRRRGRLETVAATQEWATWCDQQQYDLGEGPCVASTVEEEPFLVAATAEDDRFPRWGKAVAAEGVHAVLSVHLTAAVLGPRHEPLGALNLYARTPRAFSRDDAELVRALGAHASTAIGTAREVGGLSAAVEHRHLVGVAQGVLMQRYDLDEVQALDALQRYSSAANVKVRDLAAYVVSHRQLPEDYDGLRPVAP